MIKKISTLGWDCIPDAIFENLIWRDYVSAYHKLSDCFCGPPVLDTVAKRLDVLSSTRTYQRKALSRTLVDYNQSLGVRQSTLKQISKLENDNCFIVTTGQQSGIFTGPLFTIYKALTVIQLAHRLKEQHPDCDFVPLFWSSTEDHDLDEIDHLTVINEKGDAELFKISIKNERQIPQYLKFGQGARDLWRRLDELAPDNDYKKEILHDLQSIIDFTAGESFFRSMNYFLGDLGLAFVNPFVIRSLTKDLLLMELEKGSTHCAMVEEAGRQLQKLGYPRPMTNPDACNLFYIDQQLRYKLAPEGDGYRLKGTDKILSRSELADTINDHPEIISVNVLLRTVSQEWALPVACSVNGPGEVAYYAQFKKVFESCGLQMPILFPRSSITLIESKVAKAMERFGIQEGQIFSLPDIRESILEKQGQGELGKKWQSAENNLLQALAQFQAAIHEEHPERHKQVEVLANKTQAGIKKIKRGIFDKAKNVEGLGREQFHRIEVNVLPRGNLQEREFNIVHFACRYGKQLPGALCEQINIFDFNHQLVYL